MPSAYRSPVRRNTALLEWYGEHGRPLPWRQDSDPYRILVSEVMSQQTQMARVVPRFERFIGRWPTEHDLAEATNTEILAEWSGLGYNNRAIRLRDAARYVCENGWPSTPESLRALPGVGPYTANAIASMAFGHRVAAVDTNLRRVISRWMGIPLDGKALEVAAAESVADDAGSWNQALMDLGASLCRPRDPRCSDCPVEAWCADPTVYAPPKSQGRFVGSSRQLRGALVKASLSGQDLDTVGLELGHDESTVAATIDELVSEGLIEI